MVLGSAMRGYPNSQLYMDTNAPFAISNSGFFDLPKFNERCLASEAWALLDSVWLVIVLKLRVLPIQPYQLRRKELRRQCICRCLLWT